MVKTRVRKIGKSYGEVPPTNAPQVREGDELQLTEAPGGLAPFDPDFDETMKFAEGVMRR